MKRILVTGDLVWDNNLVQNLSLPSTHHEILDSAVLNRRAGGAWYLHDVVSFACNDLVRNMKAEIVASPRKNATKSINQAYQVWSLFEKKKGSKEKVWRIRQFLGCDTSSADENMTQYLPDEPSSPDVLVLDHLGLGFFGNDTDKLMTWMEKVNPTNIILKISSMREPAAALERLLHKYSKNLTIVLPARAIRDRGAAISQGLSWDRTIEDTVAEFENGVSSTDLARCHRVVIPFDHEGVGSFSVGLERFLYHPREHEGALKTRMPGRIFGTSSIFVSALVRHMLDPGNCPLFVALGRALAASRSNHECGGAYHSKRGIAFDSDAAHEEIKGILNWKPEKEKGNEPAGTFSSSFSHDILSDPVLKTQLACKSDLLRDLTGLGYEYVAATALDTVLRGPDEAMQNAPMVRYGNYLTADRQEIERINAIRGFIVSYQTNPKDRKPLSIAVFGPPGSGKSFAIKQLSRELFGSKKSSLEFNLSQFSDLRELHVAFHRVRDASIRGEIPLVFWDEFDSNDLKWLKEFLAPMQDAEFRDGSVLHPFGKAIFVFAGGTCATFEAFDQSQVTDETKRGTFGTKKGPDFVSRLRGFVNIKGPNPQGNTSCFMGDLAQGEKGLAKEKPYEELSEEDPAHLIRRAILLRSIFERSCPHLIDPKTKIASITTAVVRGFLRVEKFLHGARSLEAIVNMSNLMDVHNFGAAELPAADLLNLHVSRDFMNKIKEGQLEVSMIEILAEACHDAWMKQNKDNGYIYGAKRDDKSSPKTHPLMVPYSKLSEQDKEGNRKTARLTHAKLSETGLQVVQAGKPTKGDSVSAFTDEERRKLMEIEHDIWMRGHLIKGYIYAKETKEELLLHRDIEQFDSVPVEDQKLDQAIIDSILPALLKTGFLIFRQKRY